MEQGWIKLYRKILENPMIKKPSYFSLWVILLLKANHKDNQMIWNDKNILVKEGQFISGRNELSKQSGIPPSTVERILKYFEKEQQIGQQKTTKFRFITIIHWKDYQKMDSTMDKKRTTDRQQADTNKNDKKENNENTSETISADINSLIKAFEAVNPACSKYYGNTTQRKACHFMIDTYGFQRVKLVIESTLPKTNSLAFFPSINTPLQLQEKWSALESAINKYKNKAQTDKDKIGGVYW
ncbi:hypothetical protein COU49_02520 [Candidatus Nomurabacteria bacterium CG10_big_fil_rev_8_21_14_0_10_35_16]|uniref:Uncharacterized protein n=1 Tax=Candidatus Nomurabacteria bacterium CG10_big_fil_rev_8_21_14_0_10_35_16 TaxID=1974731 RepID=A0A2H0TAZ9_9BACT|nr:MAG: hypothetical protein COU49_02520 [Candidatus Nomurabacteria bacterium CG10_big_fil_rev_8_21_14_0_10_35_16]